MINRFSQRTKRLLLARSATCMQKYGGVKASGVQASTHHGCVKCTHRMARTGVCVWYDVFGVVHFPQSDTLTPNSLPT